jgi:hypothetical protein
MRRTWKAENFKMTVPYTYLLKHIPTGKFYYGCRFAEGCNPADFWKDYKTSSKYVKQLIEQYGADSFVFDIRKTFDDKQSARNWETKVLKKLNVVSREDFLNMTDNISISPEAASKGKKGKVGIYKISQEQINAIKKANTGLKRSEEVKKKMSNSAKGKRSGDMNPMFGKKMSEETKQKMRLAKIGKKRGPYNKNKNGD